MQLQKTDPHLTDLMSHEVVLYDYIIAKLWLWPNSILVTDVHNPWYQTDLIRFSTLGAQNIFSPCNTDTYLPIMIMYPVMDMVVVLFVLSNLFSTVYLYS